RSHGLVGAFGCADEVKHWAIHVMAVARAGGCVRNSISFRDLVWIKWGFLGGDMRQLLLTASILALSVGSAAAQDQVYDWSGAYVGAQAGYGWGEGKYVSHTDGQSASPRPDGFLGGIYGGYSHQLHNGVVLGVEADINANDGDG